MSELTTGQIIRKMTEMSMTNPDVLITGYNGPGAEEYRNLQRQLVMKPEDELRGVNPDFLAGTGYRFN